jgi:hypothetical protein
MYKVSFNFLFLFLNSRQFLRLTSYLVFKLLNVYIKRISMENIQHNHIRFILLFDVKINFSAVQINVLNSNLY